MRLVGEPKSDATEAPAGFDNLTNGFSEQGAAFETLNADNVVALRSFNDNRFIFEEVETFKMNSVPLITPKAVKSATRTSSPDAPAR